MDPRNKQKGLKRHETRAWLMFVTPAVLLVAAFSIYPLLYTVYLSFFKYNAASGVPMTFNGLNNFIRLIKSRDFVNSVKVTLYYTFLGVSSTMLLGFCLALLLNTDGAIVKLLRGISLMPMLICSVALTVAWQLMYNPSFGVFNMALSALGLPGQNWLGNPDLAIYALALTDTWQFTPFVMILTLAGFQSISTEYYEAAAIDGANSFQRLVRITLPLMKNVLMTILVMRVIDAFKTFEKPKILTNGGPMMTTETITLHIYNVSFQQWEFGYGAAGALVVAAIIAVITTIILRISKND